MSFETIQADTEDVLQALTKLEESVEVWKQIIGDLQASGQSEVEIAQGPFLIGRIIGPPPPFTHCEGDFLPFKPHNVCLAFDIDIYVQQIAGLFMGIYHGLAQDSNLTE